MNPKQLLPAFAILFLLAYNAAALQLSIEERLPLSRALTTNMEPPTLFLVRDELWLLFAVRNSNEIELQKRKWSDLAQLVFRARIQRPDPNLRFFDLQRQPRLFSGLSGFSGIIEYRFNERLEFLEKIQIMRPYEKPGCENPLRHIVFYSWNLLARLGMFTQAKTSSCSQQAALEADLFSDEGRIVARRHNLISTLFLYNQAVNQYLFYSSKELQLLDTNLAELQRTRIDCGRPPYAVTYNRREKKYLVASNSRDLQICLFTTQLRKIENKTLGRSLVSEDLVNQLFYNGSANQYFLVVPRILREVDVRVFAIDSDFRISNSVRFEDAQMADVHSIALPDGSQLFVAYKTNGPILFRLRAKK